MKCYKCNNPMKPHKTVQDGEIEYTIYHCECGYKEGKEVKQ